MSDPLDDAIARRMRSEVPLQAESSAALGELRGPMLRARRRRAAAVNAGRAAAALLVVSAGVFGVASLDDSEPGLVTAGSTTTTAARSSGAVATTDDGGASATVTTGQPQSTPAPSAGDATGSTAAAGTGSASTSTLATSSDPTSPAPTSAEPSSTAPSSTAPTSDGPTSTAPASTAPTTVDPSTTTTSMVASGGVQSIQSVCGSVRVRWNDQAIAIEAVNAFNGFDVEVKSSGPDKVEVSLEGEAAHCEITARIVAGALSPSVSEELEHGDGSHEDTGDSEHSDD